MLYIISDSWGKTIVSDRRCRKWSQRFKSGGLCLSKIGIDSCLNQEELSESSVSNFKIPETFEVKGVNL